MQFIPVGMWKQTSEVANARKTQDGEQTYLNGNLHHQCTNTVSYLNSNQTFWL